MPILIAPGIISKVNEGNIIEIGLEKGIIRNVSRDIGIPEEIQAQKLPQFIIELIEDGGLIPHLKKSFKK